MSNRIHTKKITSKKSGSLPSQLQKVPSAIEPKTEIAPVQQKENIQRFGFNFNNISIFAPGTQTAASLRIQPKLSIGKPGDKYEQEANSIAAKVVSMQHTPNQPLQRQTTAVDGEIMQMKPLRQADAGIEASGNLETQINATKGKGSPLSNNVRSYMEPRFGFNFAKVRVHNDSTAVQMNQILGSHAFTHGSDIYYGKDKSPHNSYLTAHELTHVVQQTGGMVQRQSMGINQQGFNSPLVKRQITAINPTLQCYEIQESEQEFLSQELETKTQDNNVKFDYELLKKQTGLKVSDDGEMAVPNAKQPKELFVTNSIIEDSNKRLEAVDSVVQLVLTKETQEVVIPGTKKKNILFKVSPTNIKNPIESTFHEAINLQQNCNLMAGLVMGKSQLSQEKGNKVIPENKQTPEKTEEIDYRKIVESRAKLEEQPEEDNAQQLGENQFAMPEVGEAYATFSSGAMSAGKHWNWHFAGVVAKSGMDAVTLENYTRGGEYQAELMKVADAISKTQEDLAAKIFDAVKRNGLEYSLPNDINIKTINNLKELLELVQKFTPEDANAINSLLVSAVQEVNQQLTELEKISKHDVGQIANALWYFQMYGSPGKQYNNGETEDQSYHSAMAATGDFSQPRTLRIRNQEEPNLAGTQGINPEVTAILNQNQGQQLTKPKRAFHFMGKGKKANQVKTQARELAQAEDVSQTELTSLVAQIPDIGNSSGAEKAKHALLVLNLTVAIQNKTAEIEARTKEITRLQKLTDVSNRPQEKLKNSTLLTTFQNEVAFYQQTLEDLLSNQEYVTKLPGATIHKLQLSAVVLRLELKKFEAAWQSLQNA
ncbi:MAG: DUF4157 domain-containing protein [Scytonematopsis contorta HA4267-MV1]|nr:DUF4157 domain-containing protein [Scytonematopsis contorta HA4267-MV1]